jgi:hypothetical protein
MTSASPTVANRWIDATTSGFKSSRRAVISDAATLASVWRESSSTRQAPTVDFSKHSLVLLAAGEQMSGGYDAVIDSVCQSPGNVAIYARLTSPPPGAMVSQMITQPADLVRIPAVTGQATWNIKQ